MPIKTSHHKTLASTIPYNIRKSLRFAEASIFTGLPVTKLEQLVRFGHVKSSKIGRTRLLDRESLEAVIDRASLEPLDHTKPSGNHVAKTNKPNLQK